MRTVQQLAEALDAALETRTRDNGESFVCLKDESPEWMTDVIQETGHACDCPELDTFYEAVQLAASALASSDDPEQAIDEIEPDVYNRDLLTWLSASLDHINLVDEALENGASGIMEACQQAQAEQRRQVAQALLEALEEQAEEEGGEGE